MNPFRRRAKQQVTATASINSIFVTPKAMKTLKVTLKKTHPIPANGPDFHVSSRMSSDLIDEIDAWAGANDTSRSEAIRRLTELGLTTRAKVRHASTARAERAKDLASKTIDNLTAASPESGEKARRKGNLIKGPEEFRQVRVDRPKPKEAGRHQ